MIDYWHHHVVRLYVRLSVTLCIVALRIGVHHLTVVPEWRVPSRNVTFLFVRSDTFAVGCIVWPQNAREKPSRRKREREFFETVGLVTFRYSLTSWTLVSHAWVDWVRVCS